MSQGRLTIVVLLGGPSAERSISLRSGAAVAAALEQRGHHVRSHDPNPGLSDSLANGSAELQRAASSSLRDFDWPKVDVVFNALHGAFGEDGELQQRLDSLRIPYTGSGAAASYEGFHKSISKRRFHSAEVPTPRGIEVDRSWTHDRRHAAAKAIGYPLVVKPEAQGSSLGVSIVSSSRELTAAIEQGFVFGPTLLLEEFIAGTEWTVPVWDDEVLPMIEVVAAEQFYDFNAKYGDDRTKYRFDSQPGPMVRHRIIAASRRAARAVGLEGLSRVDLRLTDNGQPYVLEVNSSPGMTDHSLVPKSAEYAGLTLGELCELECQRAIQRHQFRRRLSA